MNLEELQAIVQHGESDKVEFKKSTGQRTDAAKTVCAMLNGLGGFVIFGVAPDGSIVGQEIGTRTLEDVANCIAQIEPPAFPDIETITLDTERSVIVLRVSGGGLFSYEGRPYIRYGPTTRVMPREVYERKVIEKVHRVQRWENEPATGFTIDDLDHDEIQMIVKESIRRGRMDEPPSRSTFDILRGLNLINEGQLLNAAIVLFAKREKLMPFYPQCLLKMARFRGRDKNGLIDDNRQFMGNAFEIYTQAQRFILNHIPIASRFVPNVFERIDEPLYPTAALREAIANAICHRDYSISGGSISIAIYDDRLEINSTGLLHFGLTPADLLRPHASKLWNPLIAQAFYRCGIIEAWGYGTLKIIELTTEAGLVPPTFEENTGEVIVRFNPTKYVAPSQITHSLSPLQKSLLESLATSGSATLAEIRNFIAESVADRTIQANLAFLRDLNMVTTKGRGRSARWVLLNPQSHKY